MKSNFNTTKKYLIGIDEAGRGPLAGPLVVAGVFARSLKRTLNFFRGIRDSKQLSEKKREEWYVKITKHPELQWATACIAPKVIDTINIAKAANLGARRVFCKLVGGKKENVYALLDGSLYLPDDIVQETIIRGDETIPLIAAASIIAKVTRDRIMIGLHKKISQYAFDLHKGYGTHMHRELIRIYGISPLHRVTFCKKIIPSQN